MNNINGIVFIVLLLTFSPIDFNDIVFGEEIPSYHSQNLKIKYQIPEEMKGKYTQVVLWFRENTGTWQQGGTFAAGEPIGFTAPEDGTYEFSIEPLDKDSKATVKDRHPAFSNFQCRIAFSRPVVQIIDVDYRNDSALVRWRAYDKDFIDRPIEIYLVKGTAGTFLGKFPNRGVAILPIDSGELPARIKVVGIDRNGNYGMDLSKEIFPRKWIPREIKPPVTTRPAVLSRATELPTSRPVAAYLSPEENSEALREYKLGTTYRRRGELNLAARHLKRAVELKPAMVEANLDLGDVFSGLGRYNDAIESYLQALTYDAKNVRGWFGLATVRGRLNQQKQVMFCLEKVVELDEKNIQGWLDLGDTYWALGQRGEAKSAWRRVRDLVGSETRPDMKAKLESRLKMVKSL